MLTLDHPTPASIRAHDQHSPVSVTTPANLTGCIARMYLGVSTFLHSYQRPDSVKYTDVILSSLSSSSAIPNIYIIISPLQLIRVATIV